MIIHKRNDNCARLGNQLFQIAATLAHASKMETKAMFPTWEYNQYLLNPIDDTLDMEYDNIFDNIMHDDYFGFNFNYTPIEENKNLVLHGFFQSEKYFQHHKELIINHYKPCNEFLQVVKEAGKDFLNIWNTIAIHIRRGDYLKPDTANRHPVLPLTYYLDSMCELSIKIDIPVFNFNIVIFSDDIAWCKENLDHPNIYFVEGNSDIIDLYLMAQCKHHIIANSSFSWWGAWLAKNVFNNQGKTFAPKTWFGPALKDINTDDIYLDEWIKV